MDKTLLTAREAKLISCQSCHLLTRRPPDAGSRAIFCPRCGQRLHERKPNSIARTWALLIAAIIFYIPANVYPIMSVANIGKMRSDNIISGVFYFIKTGMWPIALVIFIASICVPLFKLIVLMSLLISVQVKSAWRPRDRTTLYRISETIGRWSMVDIYVVTLMVALVRLGALASITVGPAAIYFAAVVVITMLAAMSFDPRLIWDMTEERQ